MRSWIDNRDVPALPPPSSYCPLLISRRGFTLLEVMVAIAILAISFSALFGSQAQSLSLAEEAQFNIQSAALARAKLSEYESGLATPENADGDFGEDYPGYAWKVEVQEADLQVLPSLAELEKPLQRVDLTVTRDDGRLVMALRCYVDKEQSP